MDSGALNRSNRSGRQGRLRNACPSGNPAKAPRCGAKTRRGSPCQAPAMRNAKGRYTRCRLHGGASTGPRTLEGLQRSRSARWKHGRYSAVRKEWWQQFRSFVRHVRAELEAIRHGLKTIDPGRTPMAGKALGMRQR